MDFNQLNLTESNTPTGAHGLQVVLVDDSVLVRERLAASLQVVRGVALIREADDVPAGLQLLAQRAADVVVLDVEMPGQSGLDFIEIARRNGCAAKIIMLSIHDHPRLRQKCADLGADFYFHKFNEFHQVAEVCRELIEGQAP